jgi:hypothetical protein
MTEQSYGQDEWATVMPFGKLLEVPLPPNLAESLGYSCRPAERYVCFFWAQVRHWGAPDLLWFDGTMRGNADSRAWREFVNHRFVAPALEKFDVGNRSGQCRRSKDCLILDTAENRLYAGALISAWSLAQYFSRQSLESLGVSRQSDYLAAAHHILGQPVDRFEMQARRDQAISGLKEWLDAQAVPT